MPGAANAQQRQGKALSYNNINDTDAAFELVSEFDPSTPVVAIIKHANPCGVAAAGDLLTAYQNALRCDPVSAFGGIIAMNTMLDVTAAEAMTKIFTEVIIAPSVSPEAEDVLSRKKNLRLLITGSMPDTGRKRNLLRPVAGGFLLQSRDNGRVEKDDLQVVTKRQPTDDEMRDLLFAFRVAKHVKVKCDCLCQKSCDRRHWCRSDEPARFKPHCGA